jgi:hypothetical protein
VEGALSSCNILADFHPSPSRLLLLYILSANLHSFPYGSTFSESFCLHQQALSVIKSFIISHYRRSNIKGHRERKEVATGDERQETSRSYSSVKIAGKMSGYNRNSMASQPVSERSRWPPLTRMLMSGEMSGERPKELSSRERFDRWMINEGYRRLCVKATHSGV